MENFIPKGTGNSRLLKSAIAADATWEQTREQLRDGTFPVDFNGVNPAGVEQTGTPLNKATLLADDTAAQLGLTGNDKTVNKALSRIFSPQIIGTMESGTLTATHDDTGTVYSATASGGEAVVRVSQYGDYSVVADFGGGVMSKTYKVTVIEAKQYFVKPRAYDVYGVSWDGTSTTKWSRTDDAADFVDPVPAVSADGSGSSPFDTIQPWAGMVISNRTGGVMVSIPKFWYKITQNGAGMSIQISPDAASADYGFSVSPAHMDRGDGKGERDVVYVARYHGSSSNYKSAASVTPKVNITRSTARTNIHNLSSTIWQWDFLTRFTLWLLYIVEFADWNSQATIGGGCSQTTSSSSAVFNNGITDSMAYHTGNVQGSHSAYGACQYRWIEGLWDNCYDWLDGCYYNSNGLNIILNPANFSDSSGGFAVGVPSSGYPSAFTVVHPSGGFPMFYPTAASGSRSTYSCDGWAFSASNPCLFVGGSYGQGQNHGLFCVSVSTASNSGSDFGCRLLELP